VLRHLSQAARDSGLGGHHPNVLGYVDSWEEDEALFIQTELCEMGNFARFLWSYGRTFPRLDEARVWKILADLSNVSARRVIGRPARRRYRDSAIEWEEHFADGRVLTGIALYS
jgi:hypothetical protein